MPFSWPDLLRSIVDGKYFLKQFLDVQDDTGRFLADAPDGTSVDVCLTRSQEAIRRTWAERVSLSANLTHPHLLQSIASGETRIDGNQYTYLVTEHIQERLADVVAERTLARDETMAVADAVVRGLAYLHQRGYLHGKVSPSAIVAAGNNVKLLMSNVRPLPNDEVEARRAVAADLRELAETTTEMLTGKRELSAGAQLPSPFREFVRASFGTEDCPSPTAAQLLGVLNGEPLKPVKRVSPEPPPEPVPAPPPPKAEPAVVAAADDTDTGRFRPGIPALVLAGVLVLAVVIAGYRAMSGTASGNNVPVRTRVADVPSPESPRPSPVPATKEPTANAKPQPAPAAAKQQPAAQGTPAGLRGPWAVVAAAYANYDAAERRAKQLAARWDEADVTVFPARGQGSKYMVIIASAGSSREAERLRGRARGAGMPSDTYVTRLRF